jgi:hypothetical protein
MRRNDSTVRQQLAGVLEDNHSVAEQAPALFRVADQYARGLPIDPFGRRASGMVGTHKRLLIGTSTGLAG